MKLFLLGVSGQFVKWVKGITGEVTLHCIRMTSTAKERSRIALPCLLDLSAASLAWNNEMFAEGTHVSTGLIADPWLFAGPFCSMGSMEACANWKVPLRFA